MHGPSACACRIRLAWPAALWLACAGPAWAVGSFDIQISAGANLAANPEAVAAFNRAAAQWESFIADPVTVAIDADLATLDPTTLGSASNPLVFSSFNVIRNQVVNDAAAEADDAIVASLPTAAQFDAVMPAGVTLGPSLLLTKANAKALGFGVPGGADSTITFNQGFTFDFDTSDGVTAGTIDFESVAAHEIGHALGFTSAVDAINEFAAITVASPHVLDLFRFPSSGPNDPADAAQFTTADRTLVPGQDASFDSVADEWRFSTGTTNPAYPGTDGRQASHWKDNTLTGTLIGTMDPTLTAGTSFHLTRADLRSLDLIGWDIELGIPGDYDANRVVGQGDLSLVLQHWGQAASLGNPPDPAWILDDQILGDAIDQAELSQVLQNWGNTQTLSLAVAQALEATGTDYSYLLAVPEPTAAGLVLGLPALLLGRRTRAGRS